MPAQRLYDRTSTTGRGTVMKKFLIGGIALAAMAAAPAMAADMPVKAALQQPVAYYDWSGAYLGFNAGGAWYDVTHVFTTPGAITPNVTTNDRDAIFGFHAGASGSGALGSGRGSSAERLLPRMPKHQRRPARCPGLRAERVRRTQDHQPVHRRPAPRLCLGSIDDLRHRRLGVGQSQERPLLVHHQPLRRTRFHRQRRVAQQRVVCGRRLRLHGAQGRAGRRGPWRRIPALRRERLAGVLRQPRLCRGVRA